MHWGRVVMQLFKHLNELARYDVGKVCERLADFHGRAAQVAHRVENPHGRAPMRLGQEPLRFVRAFEPAPQPIEGVSRGDLCLKRAQHSQTAKSANRYWAV